VIRYTHYIQHIVIYNIHNRYHNHNNITTYCVHFMMIIPVEIEML
jgi:hypothetical protein